MSAHPTDPGVEARDPGAPFRTLAGDRARPVEAHFRDPDVTGWSFDVLAGHATERVGPPDDRERTVVRLHHPLLPNPAADADVVTDARASQAVGCVARPAVGDGVETVEETGGSARWNYSSVWKSLRRFPVIRTRH